MKLFSKKNIFSFALIFSLIATFLLPTGQVFSQSSVDAAEEKLREELAQIEKEAELLQATLNIQKSKTATISRDVDILAAEVKQAELAIQKKNIEIKRLTSVIGLKEQTIKELDEKKTRSQEDLKNLIKKSNDMDQASLPEIMLGNENLSDFFADLDSYNLIQRQLEVLFEDIRDIQGKEAAEKESLTIQQNAEADVKAEIEGQKRVVATKKSEQDNLLALSKQTEATYETVLQEKRAKAAAIRTALFQLRDSAGIPFGDALTYAERASKATGVRTAFILGILKQESDLGKNVGTCNRAGDPPSKKYTEIMPGPNDGHRSYRDDQTIFLRITKDLGLDPNTTPLSCPWGNGWGGAMGPSQFIPTTWAAYESRIASAVGVKTPNPWNPEHAIMATAIYMKDLGAAAGGYSAEREAALRYYAGGNWNLPQNAFYGTGVLNHATEMQNQIDFLRDVE